MKGFVRILGAYLLLLSVVALAYQPAWHGGFIWDDDANVTRHQLQSSQGLYRIWFELGATQQYYPLLHTAFWIEHRLWGDEPTGYHLVNIIEHALAALMVGLILVRLKVPGAYLAAAIFALHPVHVESVAWITEQKNSLSGVFFLAALLIYLGFDRTRKLRWYLTAAGLFAMALMTKTATAPLPAVILVILWWDRGGLSWRRDVRPLVPLFLMGAAVGLFTAWVERRVVGAEGMTFDLTIIERFQVAGRATWFYVGKLFWPRELLFIYPRWEVSQALWWQYLFPVTLLLVGALGWGLRKRWRGPLAGLLFFLAMIFPALGFLNVYFFVYSYVADHWQYLASIGVITPVSAGIVMLLMRMRSQFRPWGIALCLILLATLGVLTWRQSRMYVDSETVYLTTIARNPTCWMAYNNLGILLNDAGRYEESIGLSRKALELKPDFSEAHNNLGTALVGAGRYAQAIEQYQKALRFSQSDDGKIHANLGVALVAVGRIPEAIEHYQAALRVRPGSIEAHNNMGLALVAVGRIPEAIEHYQAALRLAPDHGELHYNLGSALIVAGRCEEAVSHLQQALRQNPGNGDVLNNLGIALVKCDRIAEAILPYQRALELNPSNSQVHNNLGLALARIGRIPEAIEHYRESLRIRPDHSMTHNNLGIALARADRNAEAIEHFQEALRLNPANREALANLADAGRLH